MTLNSPILLSLPPECQNYSYVYHYALLGIKPRTPYMLDNDSPPTAHVSLSSTP